MTITKKRRTQSDLHLPYAYLKRFREEIPGYADTRSGPRQLRAASWNKILDEKRK